MSSAEATSAIEAEVSRIRELSKNLRHSDALAAAEVLAVTAPEHRDVLYLIAANQRCLHRIPEALATLERLEQYHPRFSLLYQERGHCYAISRDAPRAVEAFLQAVRINPALVASWSMLERLYRMTGNAENAAKAAEQLSALKNVPPEIVRAGSLFSDGDLSAAENILRSYLLDASHVEALRLLARIEQQRNALDEAERLLERALKLSPNYRAAHLDYLRVLLDQQKYLQAHDAANTLLKLEPDDRDYLSLSAAAFAGLGRHREAVTLYRQLLATSPESADLRMLLGHSLQSIGLRREAIESFQTSAAIRPSSGDPYWSLANLKTYRFSPEEIDQMRAQETAPSASAADRYQLCFALGKAYEDRNEYTESWQFYERGNRLKRAEIHYDPAVVEAGAGDQMAVCTPQFFAPRADIGAPDPDPIFIVGLPRSGSTLLEQILASHSQVEATHELFDIQRTVLGMPRYPFALTDLAPQDFRRLGERYLAGTRAYRSSKAFFIDKMPNNFRHIGLIHLMLPNAKIIDMRREPMACCFSNFRQLFARGQEFTYGIDDIARYYCSYLDLMRHWDAVLPGRVLRVSYESIVEDLEENVRHILEFCGLALEPACLEFYKTERNIRTASSEQVRQPLFREALLQWRNYEPWLDPLKDALGDALVRYRE